MAVLSVSFFFDGCASLKEKRMRTGGLRDKFGRAHNVAIVESGHQNDHRLGEWTFVAIANSRVGVEKTLAHIEARLEQEVDGRVTESQIEWL